ncbi:hypothetical protein HY025_04645 [Candidatus Daviesbacteria bacterium]|nr:hypothetical protein [Candidatus Daviesbacteria bacterium]
MVIEQRSVRTEASFNVEAACGGVIRNPALEGRPVTPELVEATVRQLASGARFTNFITALAVNQLRRLPRLPQETI